VNDCIAIYMLDVGQGDCTVVMLPDDRVVVFDCADDHVLRKLLDNWGVQEIAAFVLSHLDQDHIAGALQFLQGWPRSIDAVYVSTDRDVARHHVDAKRAKALLDYVDEQSRDHAGCPRRFELLPNTRSPHPLASGEGWSVTLIAPPYGLVVRREREGEWQQANRHSSILRVQVGPNVMLVGGDAPLQSFSELPPDQRKAEVFRIPHHGGAIDDGGTPADWDVRRLYAEVGAATSLISVGTNNAYGHPDELWIGPITGGTCRLLCTQVTARCHAPLEIVRSDGRAERDPIAIEEQRRRVITEHNQWTEPQYRHLTDKRRQIRTGLLEVPCAGTVVVKLPLHGGAVEVLPAREGGHEQIVDGWQRPLCRAAGP
jgi:beta-lactamase superfamily II metal-dependent hydrolase